MCLGCGGVVNIGAGEEIYINSPNYPNKYDTGLICTWLIQVSVKTYNSSKKKREIIEQSNTLVVISKIMFRIVTGASVKMLLV